MAKRIKSNTKFSNVDILDFMKKVVEKHTRYYQSDFVIDKETLRRAAVRQEHQEKTFIWLCRTHGTWCLLERNVFLKDTSEYIKFNLYDRMKRGYVVDYFSIQFKKLKKIVLNIGDICIFLGAGILLITEIVETMRDM